MMAVAKDGEDQVIFADLNIEKLHSMREHHQVGVLNDWRGDIYKKYLLK